MRIFFIGILMLVLSQCVFSQIKLSQNFESTSPGSLPSGWSRWNKSVYSISSTANWTVRDSGLSLVGLRPSDVTKSKSGKRSIGVMYFAGQDSSGGTPGISDAWLVTKNFICSGGDSLRFFATGGNFIYSDSLQVWVSTSDSLPDHFSYKLGKIFWNIGSTYGKYARYAFSISQFAGQNIRIGFRYNMNCSINGYFVQLDDIVCGNPVGITTLSNQIPDKFSLSQNYPNPFNPSTKINYQLQTANHVMLSVYDLNGRLMKELVNQKQSAGTYSFDFDGSNLPSGTYVYRLQAGEFQDTKKMLLLK